MPISISKYFQTQNEPSSKLNEKLNWFEYNTYQKQFTLRTEKF